MRDEQPMPITLAIAECQSDLSVIGFKGEDALNEIYRYDIDLVSSDPYLDTAGWPGRDAFLCFGPLHCGVHGQVIDVVQHYAGTHLSHYRLTLGPSLQLLDRRRQRRIHPNLTVPELIARLLQEHDIEPCAYRFDKAVGLYPRQAAWVQYDETDLHFLHRVCEEAGVHFRFEHHPDRHVLVFADDPVTFPLQLPPLHFAPDGPQPALGHLGQLWAFPPVARRSLALVGNERPQAPTPSPRESRERAVNDVIDEPAVAHPTDIAASLRRQRGMRDLERLRCERRRVQGSSNRADLSSGKVMQVQAHPETLLNDEWLIINIRHCARQMDVLEGCDPHDITAIVEAAGSLACCAEESPVPHGYRNNFDALPWAMIYRPPLKHAKPQAFGEQSATVMSGQVDDQGRLPVRYDWQPLDPNDSCPQPCLSAHVLRGSDPALDRLQPGTRVVVAHFDGDPERPVICGVQPKPDTAALNLHVDGVKVDPAQLRLQPEAAQHLHLEASRELTLHGAQATVELNERRIRICGPQTVKASPLNATAEATESASTCTDLRLTREAGLRGEPIANCAWYIVRMARPGFEHLARIDPQHILFEGTTDAQGYLGLGAAQRRQLAKHYNSQPYALCLVHPGQCLTLHGWFEQNWTAQQRQAFRLSGL